MTYEVNDNRALTTGPHGTTRGVTLNAGIRTAARTESSEWVVTPRLVTSRYFGDDSLDADDRYIDASYATSGPRSQVAIGVNGARNTTLTTEATDVGLVDVSVPRYSLSVRPSWEYRVTERGTVGMSGTHQTADYKGQAASGLVDSTYSIAQTFVRYDLNRRTQLSATLYGSRFEATERGNTSDDHGAHATLDYQTSPTGNMSVYAGYRSTAYKVREASSTFRDNSHGTVAGLTYRNVGERVTWNGTLNRSINPSGLGFLVETTQLQLDLSQRYTDRVTFTLGALMFRNRSLDPRLSGDDRDYLRSSGGVRYLLGPQWSMEIEIRYTLQEFVDAQRAAEAGAALLTLRYHGPRWAGGNW